MRDDIDYIDYIFQGAMLTIFIALVSAFVFGLIGAFIENPKEFSIVVGSILGFVTISFLLGYAINNIPEDIDQLRDQIGGEK